MERGPSSIPGSNTALSFSRYYANLNSVEHTQTIKSEASSSYLMLFLILLFEPVFIYQWLQLPILRLPAEAIAWLTPSVLEVLSTTDLKHRGLVLKFHSDAFCPHPGQSSGTWLQTVAKIFPALFHVSPTPPCPHQILFLQAIVPCSPTAKSTVASGHRSSQATGICQKVILHCTKCLAQCYWPFSCPWAPVGEAGRPVPLRTCLVKWFLQDPNCPWSRPDRLQKNWITMCLSQSQFPTTTSIRRVRVRLQLPEVWFYLKYLLSVFLLTEYHKRGNNLGEQNNIIHIYVCIYVCIFHYQIVFLFFTFP